MTGKREDAIEKETEKLKIEESPDETNLPVLAPDESAPVLEKPIDLTAINQENAFEEISELRTRAKKRIPFWELGQLAILCVFLMLFVVQGINTDFWGIANFDFGLLILLACQYCLFASGLAWFFGKTRAYLIHDFFIVIAYPAYMLFDFNFSWRNLGRMMIRRKKFKIASKYFRKSLPAMENIYSTDDLVSLRSMVISEICLGKIKFAHRMGEKACEIAEGFKKKRHSQRGEERNRLYLELAKCHLILGVACSQSQQHDLALNKFRKSLEYSRDCKLNPVTLEVDAYTRIIGVYLELNDLEKAKEVLDNSNEHFEKNRKDLTKDVVLERLIEQGKYCLKAGDLKIAQEKLREASFFAIKGRMFEELSICTFELGNLFKKARSLNIAGNFYRLAIEDSIKTNVSSTGIYVKSMIALQDVLKKSNSASNELNELENDIGNANILFRRANEL